MKYVLAILAGLVFGTGCITPATYGLSGNCAILVVENGTPHDIRVSLRSPAKTVARVGAFTRERVQICYPYDSVFNVRALASAWEITLYGVHRRIWAGSGVYMFVHPNPRLSFLEEID